MNKPFCVIPFTKSFVLSNGSYRDCCQTEPTLISRPGETFEDWWNGDAINNIRDQMFTAEALSQCKSCTIKEQIHGNSLRLAVNKEVESVTRGVLPQGWHIMFGNVCNLACWICSEKFSSTIAQHKKSLEILPADFVDPEQQFLQAWPTLRENILKSYQCHSTVTITMLGGEPVYNKHALEFIEHLVTTGLSKLTRLEITTNGTILNNKLLSLLDKQNWQYICVFISVDAIGAKAEWLRYGCKWSTVEQNINHYRDIANYVEIQTVVSILNINDLHAVEEFCVNARLPHSVGLVNNPTFMDIRNWDGDKSLAEHSGQYAKLIGATSVPGTKQQLKQYIQQFTNRKSLNLYDRDLANAIGISI